MKQDLNDLFYYVQVVDHSGFAQAGRALSIPKSRLSRRIATLEERLGVRLIQRTSRHFSITEIGQTFYDHCKAMLVEAEAAHDAIKVLHTEPSGVIRLSCPIDLLHYCVSSMLTDFLVKYPEVELRLEATNRRIDLINEGIDIAIRVRQPPFQDSDLVMRPLAHHRQYLVASPILLDKLGYPKTPIDLSRYPSLGTGFRQKEYWSLFDPNGIPIQVPYTPRFATTDLFALKEAALKGLGVVQLPELFIKNALKTKSLISLFSDHLPPEDIVHVVFPSRRGMLPAVRILIDHLVEQFSQKSSNFD